MKRLLLMVERDGKVRFSRWVWQVRDVDGPMDVDAIARFKSGRAFIGDCETFPAEYAAACASRWWLVEAENAKDARAVISPKRACEGHAPWQCDEGCLEQARGAVASKGRIIAQGGGE